MKNFKWAISFTPSPACKVEGTITLLLLVIKCCHHSWQRAPFLYLFVLFLLQYVTHILLYYSILNEQSLEAWCWGSAVNRPSEVLTVPNSCLREPGTKTVNELLTRVWQRLKRGLGKNNGQEGGHRAGSRWGHSRPQWAGLSSRRTSGQIAVKTWGWRSRDQKLGQDNSWWGVSPWSHATFLCSLKAFSGQLVDRQEGPSQPNGSATSCQAPVFPGD